MSRFTRSILPILLLVSLVPVLAAQPAQKASNELRIHFLNIGAGSCQVVECPGNTAPLIVDCGSIGPSSTDMSSSDVKTYVGNILGLYQDDPIVVLSHGDRDHHNQIPNVMAGRNASRIWLGGKRSSYKSPVGDWLDRQEDDNVPIRVGTQTLPSGFHNGGNPVPELGCGDADTFVLTVNSGSSKNSRSLVLRVEHGNFSAIFTGDATDKTQESVMQNFPGLQTTVLTGSHHGASTHGSNHEEWGLFARPRVAVFSSGTSFKHPKCASVSAYHWNLADANPHEFWCGLDRTGSNYTPPFTIEHAEYVTERNGRIVITSDGTTHEIECSLSADCG